MSMAFNVKLKRKNLQRTWYVKNVGLLAAPSVSKMGQGGWWVPGWSNHLRVWSRSPIGKEDSKATLLGIDCRLTNQNPLPQAV